MGDLTWTAIEDTCTRLAKEYLANVLGRPHCEPRNGWDEAWVPETEIAHVAGYPFRGAALEPGAVVATAEDEHGAVVIRVWPDDDGLKLTAAPIDAAWDHAS
jgi:hypothetical protein